MRALLRRPEFSPAVLLVIGFIVASMGSKHFLDLSYLLETAADNAETALMALGMTLVIVSGNIDLSPAANLALTGCLTAKLMAAGLPPVAGIFAAILIGGALGAINGGLVAYGKLPSFLVTLGTLALYRGAAQAFTGAESVKIPGALVGADELLIAKIPFPVIVVLFVALLIGLLLHGTIFGRWNYTVGLNEGAAKFSGVPTASVKFWCFTLLGALAGLSAVLMFSRLGMAKFNHAQGQELDVITAALLGGASIAGGRGSVLGTMLAVALVAVVRAGMGLANVPTEYQLAVIGALLVVAALATGGLEKLSNWAKVARETG